jgi:hypothetical protein
MMNRTHRREFLKSTALAGAAWAVPAVAGAADKKAPAQPAVPAIVAGTALQSKINIGVIGAGAAAGPTLTGCWPIRR